MGFTLSRAEPNIWMRQVQDHYEYLAVYINDLAIASKDPKVNIDTLNKWYKFKLKVTSLIEYHLSTMF